MIGLLTVISKSKVWKSPNVSSVNTCQRAICFEGAISENFLRKAGTYGVFKVVMNKLMKESLKSQGSDSIPSVDRNKFDRASYEGHLAAVLKSIPKLYYRTFMMYFEGYKYYEISEYLNVPETLVIDYIRKVRELLKENFGEDAESFGR